MLGIIFYNVGNLQNLKNALDFQGIQNKIISSPKELDSVDKIILPGVGAFGHAADSLKKSGFFDALQKKSLEKIPIMGICVGMQLLFDYSLEGKKTEGLGLISGSVQKFEIAEKVPHMGWNQTTFLKENPLFKGINNSSWFYFVHSYFCKPNSEKDTLASSHYGHDFTSIVHKENIYGAQFHPEKSQENGLQLLKNFSELSC